MGTQLLQATKGTITVGRAPDNDHVIDHPMVSGHHARLTLQKGGFLLEDLGSANGTFVNGEKVDKPILISKEDYFLIGPARMRLGESGKVESEDLRFSTRVDVQGITYEIKNRRGPGQIKLLRDVSFTIQPGEFVALMGPAGAGKTTLMENINGNLTPTQGRVVVNGMDIHQNFDAMRGHIGYVPQDDIVHRKLTVYEACYYTAKMRMKGLSEQELHDRVVQVLTELDIVHRANTVIGTPEARVLSGGQRKRVNLAMELVTDPAIMFLDEPTSGLSSSDAKSVMQILKELCDRGRTIIITIHQPSKDVYEMMTNAIILGVGGRLIFYGEVTDAYGRFDTDPDPDSLFEALTPKSMTDADWDRMEADYKKTEWYREFVYSRATAPPDSGVRPPVARAPRSFGFFQFFLLHERMVKLYIRDKGWLVGAALGAPLAMLGLSLLLDKSGQRHVLLFTATLLAYFFGIFPSIDMMLSESGIYNRERMVNLKIPSYIMSKIVFLAAFGIFQSAAMASVIVYVVGADAQLHATFFTLLSINMAGATAGLFFSTLAPSNKVAMLFMLGWVVLMIAFSGFLVKLPDLRESGTQFMLAPSAMRWGMGGLMDVVNDVPMRWVLPLGFQDESWKLNVAVNSALSILPVMASMLILRLRDKV